MLQDSYKPSFMCNTYRYFYTLWFFNCTVILVVIVTKVAKASLDKALAENPDIGSVLVTPQLPVTVTAPPSDLHQPLVIKIDPSNDDHEKWIYYFTCKFLSFFIFLFFFIILASYEFHNRVSSSLCMHNSVVEVARISPLLTTSCSDVSCFLLFLFYRQVERTD